MHRLWENARRYRQVKTRVTLFALLIAVGGLVTAQARTYRIDIPPQPLDRALEDFAEQSELQVVYLSEIVEGIDSPGFTGEAALEDVLPALLEGSGLEWRFENDRTVSIVEAENAEVRPHEAEESPPAAPKADPSDSGHSTNSGESEAGNGGSTADPQMPADDEPADPPQEPADDEPAAGTDTNTRFAGEIVVTARKREENIQDVPMAISALDTLQLEHAGVNDFESYARMLPGLSYVDAGISKKKLAIRGLSDGAAFDPLIQSAVAVYLDEMPFTSSVTIPDIHMFDMERLEVLRGPQGTLYGAGSLGGTLRLITNKPQLGRFEAKIDATASSTSNGDPSYALNGAFNIPLGDTAALRLVGYTKEDGGFIDNVRLGVDNWNKVKTDGGRFMFRWEPNDTFGLTASATLQRSDIEGKAWYAPSQGDLKIDVPVPEGVEDRLNVYNLTLQFDLGWAELSSISSYYDGQNDFTFEFSENIEVILGPLYALSGLEPVSPYYWNQSFSTFIQELHLVSQDEGRFHWTTGLFYAKNDEPYDQIVAVENLSTLLSPLIPPAFLEPGGPFYVGDDLIFYGKPQHEVQQIAAFGEAGYDIADRWTVIVGARWFQIEVNDEDWSVGVQNIITGVGDPANKGYFSDSSTTSYDSVNPKLGLDFRVSDEVLLYASASKGFRIGGVNSSLSSSTGAPAAFGSDSLWAYELGFKTTLAGNRAILNGAVYYNDWDDIQTKLILPNGFGYRDNAGKAGVLGLELETDWMATRTLTLSAYVDIRQAELKEDFVDSASGNILGAKGDRLIGVPERSLGFAGQYNKPLSSNLNFSTRLDYQYVGDSYMFYQIAATEADKLGDYGVVNLRVGLLLASQGLEFTIFGNNLTDERAITTTSNIVDYRIYTIRPLTVGLNVRYFF